MAKRFLRANFKLEPVLIHDSAYCLLIADWRYYVKNELEIIAWADSCTPNWERKGMILIFDKVGDLTNFLLRWN